MKHTFRLFSLALFGVFSLSTHSQTTVTTTYDTITSADRNNLTPVVLAMRMNVMYLGLDNPVQISVPGKYDQAIIECSGGKISANNGYYIVKPSSSKEVIISIFTVTKGKIQDTTQYKFRVKKVPTPQITWCNRVSGETIKASCLESIGYSNTCGGSGPAPLIPRMADFDFDVYATIQSFDIKYTLDGKIIGRTENKGNQIPSDMASQIKGLPSGTIVYFENVRIVTPGGDIRISTAYFTIE